LNGRDYNQLALLSPGVLPGTPRLGSANFKGVLNVNGNRTFNNVFLLDGVDNISYSNSFRGENVQLVQPSIEALQEFKIQTNAYSAEFGRSSGAVVNATIKSGSNSLRGSVYEFRRDDALDANNFFSNLLGAPKPVRKRDQFGGAAGGPLVRNRTFWFGDYEGLRDQEGIPRVRPVPTADEKAGLFRTAVFDPFAPGRPEFPRSAQGLWTIPRDRWDPAAARIMALIPDPNVAGSAIYASTPVTEIRQDQFDVRIDHQAHRRSMRSPATALSTPTRSGPHRCLILRKGRSTTHSGRVSIDRRGSRSARRGSPRLRSSESSGLALPAATISPIRPMPASMRPRISASRTCPTIRPSSAGFPR
jgi:hypothetical protein